LQSSLSRLHIVTGGLLLVSGNWVDDMRSGNGRYRYVNGDIYDGEWAHHVRHGSGQYTYAANNIVYSGTWEYGRRVGTGSITVVGHDSPAMKVTSAGSDRF